MNIRMIFNTLGRISIAEAILLLLPLSVCFIYGEATWIGFAITIGIALVLGLLLCLCFRTKNSAIYAKNCYLYNTGEIKTGTKFAVATDGGLTATEATINGVLTAGSGSKIGGWQITDTTIESEFFKGKQTGF